MHNNMHKKCPYTKEETFFINISTVHVLKRLMIKTNSSHTMCIVGITFYIERYIRTGLSILSLMYTMYVLII